MIINHNMAAMNTHRQLGSNNAAAANNIEKLSSGLKINRAGDDAAGLAISEKMRGQIRGLDMAAKNSQDAISLIQTAEGSLNETHDILQRMRELAVQSSNDTNTADDRGEIQKEMLQLKEEVNRISTSTEFNTKKLLNGDSGSKANFGANANVTNASANEKTVAGSYTVAVTAVAEKAATTGTAFLDGAMTAAGPTTVNINGNDITFETVSGDAEATATNFKDALNNSSIGITATGDAANGIDLTSNEFGADQSITIKASTASAAMGLTANDSTDTTDIGADVTGTIGGIAASGKGTTLTGTGNANGLSVTLTNSAATNVATAGNVDVTQSSLTMHIGANKDQNMNISIRSMGASDLGINNLNLTSQSGANAAIKALDNATKEVSSERSKLGSFQNRLEHTINNLGTSSENLTAAESRIRDVDMAKEMMDFTKNNILTQAAQAMLSQANQQPQGVLQLLR